MVLNDWKVELGLDRPLSPRDALATDKLGRLPYAQAAVNALGQVNSVDGFVLSVEGVWGSGKTSTLAMMEALLFAWEHKPVVVHFNPWLVGDRDALLRHFLARIATEVKLADHAKDAKRVSKELLAYSKVFDFIKWIPGAEPWASMFKSVIASVGEATESVASHKSPDIEERKARLEEALRRFERPIIVFIDDIDRLFPLEVYEIVRIVKAVGDLPNVGYVLAWDPGYVSDALKAAGVSRSATYLDKVVQVRLPLPAIGLEARSVLINDALSRLHSEAGESHFANAQARLRTTYFSGLRELLEQPRDYGRVFNTVAVIEPALRGEVVLADIIALAALMVKAPSVYELMRKEPQSFVGPIAGDPSSIQSTEEILEAGADRRNAAIDACCYPSAVRRLVHYLFPLTASADKQFTLGRVRHIEGHIGSPSRLPVALQLSVSGVDVSFVKARQYLMSPDLRSQIATSLTVQNCRQFLECLGDIAESTPAVGIEDVERLCLEVARLVDAEPFLTEARERSEPFFLTAKDVALRAIGVMVKHIEPRRVTAIAERLASDPAGLTVAMELFCASYLNHREYVAGLRCAAESKTKLARQLATNIVDAARANRLFTTCDPSYLLRSLSSVEPRRCPKVFAEIKRCDPTLDQFALALLSYSFASEKGRTYCLPDDRSKIGAFCPLESLKRHASRRLADPALVLPVKAAWRAVVEEKKIFGVDGSYADF